MRSAFRLLPLCFAAALSVVAAPVFAQGPASTGLGQAWPNASDVSASSAYHVFVFERLGTRYVQVNDLQGNVRGAFAYGGKEIMGLPIGLDATRVATPSERSAMRPTGTRTVVYRDDTITITVVTTPGGIMYLQAVPSDCKNPAECSSTFQ
ncbi:hypothetical protein [Luteibacter sp. 9135]|uniref:hypothetical protein n=1 Tax=Luteibacter sp. 9135 TaxID=1500893 RepID=UPI00069169CD|nr:hypothetical protein [Luteibacter sp. 9135]